MNRHDSPPTEKETWFLGVLSHKLEVPTAQIAIAAGVSKRTVLNWRRKAEDQGIPTGIYDGPNNGWIFPPDHLVELLKFVVANTKPYTYRWMKLVINKHGNP